MTQCDECTAAAAGEHNGFALACKGCAARAIARGPQFFYAKHAARGTDIGEVARDDYRRLLDQVGVTHEQVKAAAANDAAMLIADARNAAPSGYTDAAIGAVSATTDST